ncbi:MAG TPA: choice-of-anchor B family protein [Planctomycetota bacterium]|jgi:choice-of-anchor B domain-containing protein|nr:choice-of-anchor B family protein [Planctomycetota bacterium]
MLSICRLQASLFVLSLLASAAPAHDGDPMLLDRKPMYPGHGWRNAERIGGNGNLFVTGPGLRFQKSNVTLLSWLTLPDMGVPAGGNGNSCFGYTSPSGREYAIIGLSTGTAFVEVTQPGNPVIVGVIAGPQSLWRDMRTFSHYSYSVSEGGGGVQVVDLANIDNGVVSLVNTINDDGNSATHTLAINPTSGYLYRSGGGSVSQGLRIYNLNANAANPPRVGSWNDRYSHEASIFNFTTGPAAGRELAFVCGGLNQGFSSTGLHIVDVTNKAAPTTLQFVAYANAGYCHQCWPSSDMHYLYLDDELDDQDFGITCQTRVFDISNPLAVSFVTTFTNGNTSIDHNQYTKGTTIYQSNYRSGLRVKSTSNPGTPTAPVEVAYFDTWPEDDDTQFNSLWNNYPYFQSGVIIGSDIEKGLFVWWVGTPQLTIASLAGDPETIDPSGATLGVQIGEIAPGTLVPGTAKLHYDNGGGWVAVDLVPQGGGTYAANLPASSCGSVVRYYFSAQSSNGVVWSEPEDAPAEFHQALSGVGLNIAQFDDFQNNTGWTSGAAGDNATAGLWVRVDPNGTEAAPADDHTPGAGTMCWVTGQGAAGGQASAADVDGGHTTLVSPTYDVSALANPVIRYWRWYSNCWTSGEVSSSLHTMADVFRVDLSNNNGNTWVNVETVGPSGLEVLGGWIFHQFRVSDFMIPTPQMKIRFVAEDAGTGSIVEAGVDDFQIVDPGCGAIQSFCSGDGTGQLCPCFNSGGPGRGCDNSAATGGALITSTGTASLAADTLVLTSDGERATAFSLFLQGDAELAGVAFGDGLRCAGGNLRRLYSRNAVGGSVTAPTGGDPSISARSAALGDTIPSLATRIYQVYYRDPTANFCAPPQGGTFNVSNALRVVWGP